MRIYIAGVGVGMGPLAFLARDLGFDVVLSDLHEHELVEYMRSEGFTVHVGQNGDDIAEAHEAKPIDWFVHTSALPKDHAELRYAHDVGMKVSKRDEFINEMLIDHNLKMIAVAGTHGKTNTTAMIVWALQQANIPVSYSIGARIGFGPFGKYEKGSKYFVYEADEFDRNFLQYHPAISIVTNISYDHPDTYPDQLDYDEAFAIFINQSNSVYIYADDFAASGDRITVIGKDEDESSTTLPGKYIRQNARLVLEMLNKEFDLPYDQITDALNQFPGTSRRMEKLQKGLYSDYAHHPEEIQATMETSIEIADSVVVVYQPHQNVRQHEILNSYGDCFAGASKVYWLPTYLSREDPELDIIPPADMIAGLSNPDIAEEAEMNGELAQKIRDHIAEGSLVVGMAAGDLDAWLREII